MYNYMLFPFIQGTIVPFFYRGKGNIGFLILFLAALFRPLGSLFFGYVGDKYSRKLALLLAMGLMIVSCFLMLFLPGYHAVGNYAVIGLLLARVLQVLSISGEHAGVAICLIEFWRGGQLKKFDRYGLASGLIYFFSMLGTFLATCVVSCVDSYTWKYAYCVSVVLIMLCFFLRSLPYSEALDSEDDFLVNEKAFYRNFCACLLISAAMSGLYYFNTVFIGVYFLANGVENFRIFSAVYMFIYMCATFFWGWVSDFFERLYLFILIPCSLLFFSLVFTLYWCNPYWHCFNIIMLAMYAGPSHAYFFKLFPRKHRYSGISVAYSLGTAFIGSSTPFVASILMSSFCCIVLYVFLLCSLSFCGLWLSYTSLRNTG